VSALGLLLALAIRPIVIAISNNNIRQIAEVTFIMIQSDLSSAQNAMTLRICHRRNPVISSWLLDLGRNRHRASPGRREGVEKHRLK